MERNNFQYSSACVRVYGFLTKYVVTSSSWLICWSLPSASGPRRCSRQQCRRLSSNLSYWSLIRLSLSFGWGIYSHGGRRVNMMFFRILTRAVRLLSYIRHGYVSGFLLGHNQPYKWEPLLIYEYCSDRYNKHCEDHSTCKLDSHTRWYHQHHQPGHSSR